MAAAFKAALGRVGFSIPQRDAVTLYGGFTDIGDLSSTTEEDMTRLATTIKRNAIIFPTMIEKKLNAIRYWSRDNDRFGYATVPTDMTLARCQEYVDLQARHEKLETRANKLEKNAPDAFKDIKTWRKFDGKFREYLDKHRGEQGIPLTYLIRDLDIPNPTATYTDTDEERAMTVPLAGDDFDDKNKVLMGFLKELLIDGPAWAHAKTFERAGNGRQAYLKCRNTYMGGSSKSTLVQSAEGLLGRMRYVGEKRNFTIEKFIEKVTNAFNDIEMNSDQVFTDPTKVTKLLTMIQCPTLESTKIIIKSNPKFSGSYDDAQNLILSTITSNRIDDLDKRNVSGAHTSPGGGRGGGRGRGGRGDYRGGRGGHGRGRGRGRFNNQYHPYGGRGGGRGGRGTGYNADRGSFPTGRGSGRISDDKWHNMSPAERFQVHEDRRNASGANSHNEDTVKVKDEMEEDDNPLNQFGQKSTRKKKGD